jgi:quaternary ammonium compound-resistance protein SugE
MAWLYLLLAAACEVGFTTSLKLTESGNGRLIHYAAFVAFAAASFGFLKTAIATVPIGIAYAVWTGLGAAGTLIASAFWFREPISHLEWVFIMMMLVAVFGLNLARSS